MLDNRRHFINILQLNFAVLLISTSGVLGRYITLHPTVTIFYRTLLASVIFYGFCRLKKIDLKIHDKKDLVKIIISGIFLCAHWITYFFSLQLSNVAIALLSLFTYPVMTAFLEPVFLKTKFDRIHLALGLLVLAGIYFLSPELDFDNDYFIAVLLGILSALFYAIRNILLKREVAKYNGSSLMFYQITVVAIILLPVIFFYELDPVLKQWKPLLLLAVLTTCIGHTLFLMSFKNFSITAASIMSSIQPVYGIILGVIFLNEIPGFDTVIGGLLIISAVIIESLISFKKKT